MLIAEMPSIEEAIKSAKLMKNCPHLVASGINSNEYIGIYIVPKDMTWWLKIPQEKPEIMGARSVHAFIATSIIYPEKHTLRLPETKSEIAPCGANCSDCPLREEYQCECCPASTHYLAK